MACCGKVSDVLPSIQEIGHKISENSIKVKKRLSSPDLTGPLQRIRSRNWFSEERDTEKHGPHGDRSKNADLPSANGCKNHDRNNQDQISKNKRSKPQTTVLPKEICSGGISNGENQPRLKKTENKKRFQSPPLSTSSCVSTEAQISTHYDLNTTSPPRQIRHKRAGLQSWDNLLREEKQQKEQFKEFVSQTKMEAVKKRDWNPTENTGSSKYELSNGHLVKRSNGQSWNELRASRSNEKKKSLALSNPGLKQDRQDRQDCHDTVSTRSESDQLIGKQFSQNQNCSGSSDISLKPEGRSAITMNSCRIHGSVTSLPLLNQMHNRDMSGQNLHKLPQKLYQKPDRDYETIVEDESDDSDTSLDEEFSLELYNRTNWDKNTHNHNIKASNKSMSMRKTSTSTIDYNWEEKGDELRRWKVNAPSCCSSMKCSENSSESTSGKTHSSSATGIFLSSLLRGTAKKELRTTPKADQLEVPTAFELKSQRNKQLESASKIIRRKTEKTCSMKINTNNNRLKEVINDCSQRHAHSGFYQNNSGPQQQNMRLSTREEKESKQQGEFFQKKAAEFITQPQIDPNQRDSPSFFKPSGHHCKKAKAIEENVECYWNETASLANHVISEDSLCSLSECCN